MQRRMVGLAGTGLGYTLGHNAVVAAKTVSHYSWWVTIGILILTVLLVVRSQRQARRSPDSAE